MTSAGGINSLAPKKRGVKISLLIAGVRRSKSMIVEAYLNRVVGNSGEHAESVIFRDAKFVCHPWKVIGQGEVSPLDAFGATL